MSQQSGEAAVQEFLESRGRGDIGARVLKAMPALSSDVSTWVLELQAMERDGELDAFLDACAPNAQQDHTAPETSSTPADDISPKDERSNAPGGSPREASVADRSATPSASRRNAAEVDESLEVAVELAAEVALENGGFAEEIFAVSGTVKGKKKPRDMQLKVGQMSLQLFHGGALLDSWRYPDLGAWEFAENEQKTGKLMLRMGRNKNRDADLEFVCSTEVGPRCCELMKQHATVMHQEELRKQEADHQKQRERQEQMLHGLRGEYTVSPQCLLIREAAALESPKIAIIDSGEAVRVVDAVIIEGKIRVHVVGDELKMRNSYDSQLASIDGWGSWISSTGANLLLERLPRSPQHETLKGAARLHYCLGEYVTEQAGGLLVRAGESEGSEALCSVAPGERIEAVEAKFVGKRLQLRIKSDSVKLVGEPGQPDRGGVDGWVNLRDHDGASLLTKVRSSSPDSGNETTGGDRDEDDSDDKGDEFQTSGLSPVVPPLVLHGSIQDQIEDALSPSCKDVHVINLVLERVAAKKYSHPSVNALQMKSLSLNEQAQHGSGSSRPSSTPDHRQPTITQRRMSVAQEGVNSVVDLARQAAASSGIAGEKMFNVSIPNSGRKSATEVQLKVSQMGVQVFDGPQVIDSYLYANLSAWEFKAGKRLLVLQIAAKTAGEQSPATGRAGSSKAKTKEFACTPFDGAQVCKLMTDHATTMMKQQRSEMKQHLLHLRGKYTVTTLNGVLMRGHASPESFKVGIIANSEELEVIEAVLTGGRTRLHAIGSSIHMDDGTRQDVDGWISLKNAAGTPLVEKSDAVVAKMASPRSRQPTPPTPKPTRLQSLRRHSVAIGGPAFPGPASPRKIVADSQKSGSVAQSAAPIVEVRVKQTHIEQAAAQVTLRCEPLAARLMDGPRCVSSITYRSLAGWQIIPGPTPNQPRKVELAFINGDTVALQCVRLGDAEKVSLAMTKHAEKLAQRTTSPRAFSSSPPPTQHKQQTTHTSDAARGLKTMRRASVAVGMPAMEAMPKTRKAFIKNSAFMFKSVDGETSFVAKQKTPQVRDVTLLLHNFGMEVSAHLGGERPVTYTYKRVASWKILPNGDLCLKILSLEGDLEIFNFATRDAQKITELLTQYSGGEPATPTALQQDEVVEPGDRCECVDTCVLTAEWERTSEQTGQVMVGQVIEVASATINHQKQWRVKVSRAWNDASCTVSVPSLEGGWVSMKKVSGEPNFLPLGGEQNDAAQPSLDTAQQTESAFWRETRLLEEAERRARNALESDGSCAPVVEPIRMAKKMMKPSKNHTEKPILTSDTDAARSVDDLQELQDPVSPHFLQDAVSAIVATDDWPVDAKFRLQEQHALQQAEQQRKIASLETQIANLHTQLATKPNDAHVPNSQVDDVQTELMTARQIAAEATKRAVVAETRAEQAETKLAQTEQEKQQLQVTVYEHQQQLQCIAEQQDVRQLGNSDRIAELEAGRASNERCLAALSEELDRATSAMRIHHDKIYQLTVAHDAAKDQIDVLEQQKRQLERRVADQGSRIHMFDAQTHELEQVQRLKVKLSSLENKVAEEQTAQVSLRRDNAELKIQVQSLQMAHRGSPSGDVAAQETTRAELTALQAKAHETALEIETLRTELARTKCLAAETEIRETKANAQIADAHRRSGLLTQKLQTATDELHAERAVVRELKEQVAGMDAVPSSDSLAVTVQQELEALRAEHTAVQEKLQTEVALREELELEKEELSRNISVGQEARKRLEDETRAGWEKADVEAGLRMDALNDKRAMQVTIDELTRDLKKQQSLLDATMQRHEDAQRKLKVETERSHAAELNAQHVASRARAASAEMRSNMVDIQSKYEKQLAAVRAEKAKIEVSYDQAVQERQRIQEWVHEHMAATQERLLNSSAAVEASEKARDELQPRLEKADAEVRKLQNQLRRVTHESARAQQQVATQLEHHRSVSQAERGRLEAQVAQMTIELEEQRQNTAVERDKREASDRRVDSELEAARVAEQNAMHAIRDAKTELGTTLEEAELRIAQIHREEIDRLRFQNAKLEGQLEHSVRNYDDDVANLLVSLDSPAVALRTVRRSSRRVSYRH